MIWLTAGRRVAGLMIVRGIEWSWFGQDQRLVLSAWWKRIAPDTGIFGWLTDREAYPKQSLSIDSLWRTKMVKKVNMAGERAMPS